MAILNKSILKQYFKTGKKPTEQQFCNLIESSINSIDDAYKLGLSEFRDDVSYFAGTAVVYQNSIWVSDVDIDPGPFDENDWTKTGDHQNAAEVEYDNTASGLTAENVQDAIDELNDNISDDQTAAEVPYTATTGELTADNVQDAIDELYTISSDDQTAAEVPYSPSTGELTANNVQDAIDELYGLSTDELWERSTGDASLVPINTSNTASGTGAIAIGFGTNAVGKNSFSQGDTTKAIGDLSHSEGGQTLASGTASHAEGNQTEATGAQAHAEGNASDATGDNAHAEGDTTLASGDSSHAEGDNTEASGLSSHAEGSSSLAEGLAAHAEGGSTSATGNFSHAEGLETVAAGAQSHSEGNYTNAIGSGSHAGGVGHDSTLMVVAQGEGSFNHSGNTAAQTAGNGAKAGFSAILGGQDHHIEDAHINSVILGGTGIISDAANTVFTPNAKVNGQLDVLSDVTGVDTVLTAQENGQVGINTGTPDNNLTVVGTSNFTDTIIGSDVYTSNPLLTTGSGLVLRYDIDGFTGALAENRMEGTGAESARSGFVCGRVDGATGPGARSGGLIAFGDDFTSPPGSIAPLLDDFFQGRIRVAAGQDTRGLFFSHQGDVGNNIQFTLGTLGSVAVLDRSGLGLNIDDTGQSSPDAQLHVVTRSGAKGLLVEGSTTGTGIGPAIATLDNGNVGIGTDAPTESLHVDGTTLLEGAATFGNQVIMGNVISPEEITVDVDSYDPPGFSDANVLRIYSNSSNIDINGLKAPSPKVNKILMVINVGNGIGGGRTLRFNDANSAVSDDNILAGASSDKTLDVDDSAVFMYDAASSVWRIISINN